MAKNARHRPAKHLPHSSSPSKSLQSTSSLYEEGPVEGVRARPALALLFGCVYAVWLGFLAYVAWQSQAG